ncbi:aromatic ring-hydroxylating dioxygenase subunit alpha [Nostoc sp. CENA67]|uniref:cholesterol 7-desaturase n=1 Tax=Amazonocrinis nigriterrae CENA67 TaxID=2794033 RepID=A0A8J7HT26_9NOST|nr:Rieske 2Fe-2S domain-containing protein [Amazonocrinis nigriterrae]MBH8561914.1 aromatic ring-hydroxylating dioxygenase subunit alpha [Amazonocrinis nigriterrae CENA67]
MNNRYPFSPFPNGWFRIAYSNELTVKKVIPLHYFGKDLVLFRTEDGIAHVFDAHCPHLGAHLGYGGCIKGNNIHCPFHGWGFNSQGDCINIPYANKIPPKSQIYAWPVREFNGMIMVYHHAEKKPPTWEMTSVPKWDANEWTPFKSHRWKIRIHPQEMAENAMDSAHMTFLHHQTFRELKNPCSEIEGPLFIRRVSPKYHLPFVGKLGAEAEGLLEVACYGLGCQIAYSSLKVIVDLNAISVVMPTPIDEEYLEVHIVISVKKLFNPILTWAFANRINKEVVSNIEQDIPIWENKLYRPQPLLCDRDGPIMQYRQWVRQFYSDMSATTREKFRVNIA